MNNILHDFITSNLSPTDIPYEDREKVAFINIFSALGIVTFLLFGSINTFLGNTMGLVELLFSSLLILNITILRTFKMVSLASTIMLLSVEVPLIFLIFNGGIANTGIFWFSTYPLIAFFLKGTRQGSYWCSALSLVIFVIIVLSYLGIIKTAYDPTVLRQLLANFFVLCGLAYFYEKNVEEIRDKRKALGETKKERTNQHNEKS